MSILPSRRSPVGLSPPNFQTRGLKEDVILLEHSIWNPASSHPNRTAHAARRPPGHEQRRGASSAPGPRGAGFAEQRVLGEASGSPDASYGSPSCVLLDLRTAGSQQPCQHLALFVVSPTIPGILSHLLVPFPFPIPPGTQTWG